MLWNIQIELETVESVEMKSFIITKMTEKIYCFFSEICCFSFESMLWKEEPHWKKKKEKERKRKKKEKEKKEKDMKRMNYIYIIVNGINTVKSMWLDPFASLQFEMCRVVELSEILLICTDS